MFKTHHHHRFRKPALRTPDGSKVMEGGALITGAPEVLNVWENHFRKISTPKLQEIAKSLPEFKTASRLNCDSVIGDGITNDDIELSLKKIKCRKRGGEDGVCAEHLRYGGEWLKMWMKKIFNEIVTTECIPACMKSSLIKPIYKGRGKDPLLSSI